jgi:hypothetical protein
MSTTENAKQPASDAKKPAPWVGIGESLVPDMRNREILCYGTRVGDELTVEKAYELEGWQQKSLVQALLQGPESTLDLEEIDDFTDIAPSMSFDLPEGSGFGNVLYAFQQAARGFGSVLERVASEQNGFHLLPRLFDRLWREIGGGGQVRVHRLATVAAERAMVASGDAWKKGRLVSHAAQSEQAIGPRHQYFGPRVLRADIGMCPECGSPMVKTRDGRKVCELELMKAEVPPPEEDVANNPAVQEALIAELGGAGSIDVALLEPVVDEA